MKVNLNNVAVEVPEGFQDQTDYAFNDDREAEYLSVRLHNPSANSPEELIAIRHEEMGAAFATAPAPPPSQKGAVVLAGVRWVFSDMVFDEAGEKRWNRFAVAMPSPKRHVAIDYMTFRDVVTAKREVEHVLASVSFGPPVPGFPTAATSVTSAATTGPPEPVTRRRVGEVTLDVPARLIPPRIYTFGRQGDAAFLRFAIEPLTARRDPPAESRVDRFAEHGMPVRDRAMSALAAGGGVAKVVACTISDAVSAGKAAAIREADVFLRDVAVSISYRAPIAAAAPSADEEFGAIIGSLQFVGGQPK